MKKLRSLFLLLLCGVMFLTFAVGSTGDTKKANVKTYGLDDNITINSTSGDYRIKFTDVTETSNRNQFSDVEADRVIIIEYEYENISQDDSLYVSSLNFKVYDKDNNQLESYPATNTKYGGSVAKGRKATASVAYALNNDDDYIEIEYYDNMFHSNPDCKVEIRW